MGSGNLRLLEGTPDADAAALAAYRKLYGLSEYAYSPWQRFLEGQFSPTYDLYRAVQGSGGSADDFGNYARTLGYDPRNQSAQARGLLSNFSAPERQQDWEALPSGVGSGLLGMALRPRYGQFAESKAKQAGSMYPTYLARDVSMGGPSGGQAPQSFLSYLLQRFGLN